MSGQACHHACFRSHAKALSMNRWISLLAACLFLVACGGGGGGGQAPAPAPVDQSPPPTPTPDPPGTPDPTPEPTPEPPPTEDPLPPQDPRPENPVPAKSAKRGIAYDLADPRDLAALAPGVSWWYRWALKPAAGVPSDYRERYGMDFIPMLWNGNFNAAEVEAFLRDNPHIKFLLLLNEPNLTDQANMRPQQAAELWPRYEAIAANTGVQLVGPAMTWGTMPGYADPVVWLDAFYAAYRAANDGRDPRIDYLAFHWYDYGLAGQLDRLTKYGKQFWVTEFANWHSNNDGAQIDSVAKQKAQMTEMVAVCESRSDVFRYAWFTGRWPDEANRHTSLLGAAGELTELGEHYLAQPYWVGSWVNPQISQKSSDASNITRFEEQTLRQVVRSTVPANAVRIRLSNAAGTEPVTVSNVHIAPRSADSSIDAGSDRQVTFGGRASVTLPPGGEAYSDRIEFAVPAQADLAISFYLPRATMLNAGRGDDWQLTYVAAGDVSASADIAVTHQTSARYLLASLEAEGEGLRGSLAIIGGSITAGVGIEAAGESWPDVLAERLEAANIRVGVLNAGDGYVRNAKADRAQDPVAQPNLRAAIHSDPLVQPNLRWVIYSDPLFEELRLGQASLEQLIEPLKQTIADMHRRQVKVLCSTLTPYEGHSGWNADAEGVRQAYNAWVRSAESGCDAVVDQDRAVRDPARPTRLLRMYDSGDHLHPNASGHRAIAEAVGINQFLGM